MGCDVTPAAPPSAGSADAEVPPAEVTIDTESTGPTEAARILRAAFRLQTDDRRRGYGIR